MKTIVAVAAESPEAAAAGIRAIVRARGAAGCVRQRAGARPRCPANRAGPLRWPAPQLLALRDCASGQALAALKDCAVTLDEKYSVTQQEHAYLETEGALAIPTADGGIVVYASNQSPFINRGNLADVLGLPQDRVRIIQPPVGGSFGGKDDLNYQASAQCAALALKTGRPVKMTFSREESMIASYKHDGMRMHVRLGAAHDGSLKACKFEGLLDSGAYASQSVFTAWRAANPHDGHVPV